MTLMSLLGVDIIEGQRSRSPLLYEETIKPSMPSKEITEQQSKRKDKATREANVTAKTAQN